VAYHHEVLLFALFAIGGAGVRILAVDLVSKLFTSLLSFLQSETAIRRVRTIVKPCVDAENKYENHVLPELFPRELLYHVVAFYRYFQYHLKKPVLLCNNNTNDYLGPQNSNQTSDEITTAQRCRSETEKFILEDLFSSILSQFKRYHPSGNLKFNYLGIFPSLKLHILISKNLFYFSYAKFYSKYFGLIWVNMDHKTKE